jgi:integral membrane protein
MSPRLVYRTVSIAEALTWTALLVAMLARYAFGAEVPFFFAIGLAHGAVFIAFVAATVVVGLNQRWRWWLIALAGLMAVPPYGTVVMDARLERHGRLDGGWRTEAGSDPRDAGAIDRMLRWFLRHPAMFAVLLVVVVAAITLVALVVGPPVG